MKCQILFYGGKKRKISAICCLLKILPRVLSVKMTFLEEKHMMLVEKHKFKTSEHSMPLMID